MEYVEMVIVVFNTTEKLFLLESVIRTGLNRMYDVDNAETFLVSSELMDSNEIKEGLQKLFDSKGKELSDKIIESLDDAMNLGGKDVVMIVMLKILDEDGEKILTTVASETDLNMLNMN